MDSSKQIQTMRYTQTVKINYIMPSVDAIFYLSTDTKSPEKLTDQVDIRQIDITNARLLTHPSTLVKDGFGFTNNCYHVSDHFDDKILQQELYPQVISHLLLLTSAVRGIVFDHTLRSVEDNLLCTEKRSQ